MWDNIISKDCRTHPGMTKVAFSPKDICGTPWSQPKGYTNEIQIHQIRYVNASYLG
jgi:hypothetical protein